MEALFDRLEFPFFSPRKHRKLTKYAILLNEPKTDQDEDSKEQLCSLATELLPDLSELQPKDDMVEIIGCMLQSKIKSHAEVDEVPIFKPDDIIQNNAPTLVPVMYRIATEHFAQKNASTFKIIECRNSTKLISDWKPSLPDKLISLGHQVIVVQLETSFVPYTDFSYAILRQLDCEWKNRLPKSFFFPDDVCKVSATPERDLCVVSPSMPDGDLEINKKMGLLNYELLMMIKSSCMSAMKNYLLKRDLRVGKFSDTLDGVSALRQLYRRLQERLKTGETVELGSSSLEDLRSLIKQTIGGPDVLAAQTWIEYGKQIGLDIPASASSSATSISSARKLIQGDSGSESDGKDEKDDKEDDGDAYQSSSIIASTTDLSSSGFDIDDGMGCLCLQKKKMTSPHESSNNVNFPFYSDVDDLRSGSKEVLLQPDGLNGNKRAYSRNGNSRGRNDEDDDARCGSDDDDSDYIFTTTNKDKNNNNSQENEQDENDGLKLEDFTEFRNSLAKIHKTRKVADNEKDEGEKSEEEDYDEFPTHEFSAESILQILQLPNKITKRAELNLEKVCS